MEENIPNTNNLLPSVHTERRRAVKQLNKVLAIRNYNYRVMESILIVRRISEYTQKIFEEYNNFMEALYVKEKEEFKNYVKYSEKIIQKQLAEAAEIAEALEKAGAKDAAKTMKTPLEAEVPAAVPQISDIVNDEEAYIDATKKIIEHSEETIKHLSGQLSSAEQALKDAKTPEEQRRMATIVGEIRRTKGSLEINKIAKEEELEGIEQINKIKKEIASLDIEIEKISKDEQISEQDRNNKLKDLNDKKSKLLESVKGLERDVAFNKKRRKVQDNEFKERAARIGLGKIVLSAKQHDDEIAAATGPGERTDAAFLEEYRQDELEQQSLAPVPFPPPHPIESGREISLKVSKRVAQAEKNAAAGETDIAAIARKSQNRINDLAINRAHLELNQAGKAFTLEAQDTGEGNDHVSPQHNIKNFGDVTNIKTYNKKIKSLETEMHGLLDKLKDGKRQICSGERELRRKLNELEKNHENMDPHDVYETLKKHREELAVYVKKATELHANNNDYVDKLKNLKGSELELTEKVKKMEQQEVEKVTQKSTSVRPT